MAHAGKCDKCGELHAGVALSALLDSMMVADGTLCVCRWNAQIGGSFLKPIDLCPSCIEDFGKWWQSCAS